MWQIAQACPKHSPKRAVGSGLSISRFSLLVGALMALGITQPVRAQAASPLPPEMMKSTIEQMSNSLAQYVSGASCTDIAQLIKMLPTNASNLAPDPNSILGAVILSVKNSPDLQSIIASRVGPPLIGKVIECNMISPELLFKVMSR